MNLSDILTKSNFDLDSWDTFGGMWFKPIPPYNMIDENILYSNELVDNAQVDGYVYYIDNEGCIYKIKIDTEISPDNYINFVNNSDYDEGQSKLSSAYEGIANMMSEDDFKRYGFVRKDAYTYTDKETGIDCHSFEVPRLIADKLMKNKQM